nr:Asp-tRNA(Asn)/Glu-tRNA(Gln) amidotransferase subunit GatC [Anaerolineae bacterium]
MTLSKEEVEHIAELARLILSPEEKERFRVQLSAILDYAERIQLLNTDGTPPMTNVLPLKTVLRDDIARSGTGREHLLVNATEQEDSMYRVGRILD